MPQHDRLFLFQLKPDAHSYNGEAEPAMQPAKLNRGSEAHQKYTGINGMPRKTVGPGFYELVAFFENDPATPIPAQRPARPYGDGESRGANSRANDRGNIGVWCKRQIQRIMPGKFRQNNSADNQWNPIGEHGPETVAFSHGLPAKGADEPIGQQEEPAIKNDEAGDRRHIRRVILAGLKDKFKPRQRNKAPSKGRIRGGSPFLLLETLNLKPETFSCAYF